MHRKVYGELVASTLFTVLKAVEGLSAIHGRTATFLIRVEITFMWRFGWFLITFGPNKSRPLPPGPLIWTPMDLSDLEHVVRGLIKLWEAHKLL